MTATQLITDGEILANRFNLAELRRELHHADVNCLPDWPDSGYWYWYKDVVAEAIAIKKQTQPKTKPIAGHINIESIKARVDILTIVESYGLKPRKAGHTFKSCCPFHTEKTPSFVIYPDENRFHCFGCQAYGDVFGFVMKIENCDFKTAAAKVGDLL